MAAGPTTASPHLAAVRVEVHDLIATDDGGRLAEDENSLASDGTAVGWEVRARVSHAF